MRQNGRWCAANSPPSSGCAWRRPCNDKVCGMTISTHVLDAAAGGPAAGVPVVLERRIGATWTKLAAAITDSDGRVANLGVSSGAGVHRLRFDVETYAGPD